METFQKFIKFILKSFIVGSAFSLKNIFVIATWSMANNDWLTSAVLVFAAIIGALLKLFIVYGGSMILISMGLGGLVQGKDQFMDGTCCFFLPSGYCGPFKLCLIPYGSFISFKRNCNANWMDLLIFFVS